MDTQCQKVIEEEELAAFEERMDTIRGRQERNDTDTETDTDQAEGRDKPSTIVQVVNPPKVDIEIVKEYQEFPLTEIIIILILILIILLLILICFLVRKRLRERKKEQRRKAYEQQQEPQGAKLTQQGVGPTQHRPPPIMASSGGASESSGARNSPRVQQKTGIGAGMSKSPTRLG